jgi:hypothetical protein
MFVPRLALGAMPAAGGGDREMRDKGDGGPKHHKTSAEEGCAARR